MAWRSAACAFGAALLLFTQAGVWAQTGQKKAGGAYDQCLENGRAFPPNDKIIVDICSRALRELKGNQLREFDAWRFRSGAYFREGKVDDALADINRAVAVGSKLTGASEKEKRVVSGVYAERANIFFNTGRFRESLADIDAMQRLEGRSVFVLRTRARHFEAGGELQRAEQSLTDAISAATENRDRIGSLQSRALVRLKQGKTDSAFADLDEGDRLQPGSSEIPPNYRAWMLAESGSLEEASASLMRVQQNAPNKVTGSVMAYLRGYVEAARGDFSEAANAFGPATVDTQKATGLVQAVAHIARRRANMPNTMMLEATRFGADPSSWSATLASFVLGTADKAKFEAAIAHGNPNRQKGRRCDFHFIAGQVALLRDDKAEARNDLARAVDACPVTGDTNIWMVRIWAKGDLARLGGAAGVTPSSVTPAPSSPPASGSQQGTAAVRTGQNPFTLFREGQLLILANDIDAAIRRFEAAVQLEPNNAQYRKAHTDALAKKAAGR